MTIQMIAIIMFGSNSSLKSGRGSALDVCSGNIFGHFSHVSYYHVVNLHILISETINDWNSGFKKQKVEKGGGGNSVLRAPTRERQLFLLFQASYKYTN
jgi:hypothetical protein